MGTKTQLNNLINKCVSLAKKIALAVILVAFFALISVIAFIGSVSPELFASIAEPNFEIAPASFETENVAYGADT